MGSASHDEIELDLRAQAKRHRIHRFDVLRIPMTAIAYFRDRRLGGADQLHDVGIGQFGMVAQQPIDRVRLVLALGNRRIARRLLGLDVRHLVFRRRHLELQLGIFLGLFDLVMGELAGGDRVDALDSLGHVLVRNTLHLEGMHADELGDLLEGERGVVDQPDGGRLGHQGLVGHGLFLSVRGSSGTPLRSPGITLSRKAPY